MKTGLVSAVVLCGVLLFFGACGGGATDGVSACAAEGGKICNTCGLSCSADCKAGETEYCVGLDYFGDENEENVFCSFCGD